MLCWLLILRPAKSLEAVGSPAISGSPFGLRRFFCLCVLCCVSSVVVPAAVFVCLFLSVVLRLSALSSAIMCSFLSARTLHERAWVIGPLVLFLLSAKSLEAVGCQP